MFAHRAPWLQLDDGTLIAQSIAINTFIAETTGFMPRDALQRARTLELAGCFEDVRSCIPPVSSGPLALNGAG